jgi:uncharacterized membrane protein
MFTISRNKLFLVIITWWLFFVALSIRSFISFQILNIAGFTALIILPGLLTLLILKINLKEFWGYMGLTVGISLLELMILGLLVNTLLPNAGFDMPLTKEILLPTISFFIIILTSIAWYRNNGLNIAINNKLLIFENNYEFILAFFPVIFVLMSILGAIRLNNGEDGIITLMMLIGIGIYMSILIFFNKKLGENVIPTAFFFISLSLLFMTSLRGWYITGHDIQVEFSVFELAANNNLWSIASFHNAYNACLSITILPTIFSKLLHISDPYVFKVLFQIIFAMVPSIIYLTIKKYTTSFIAILSVIYFISFPTFFGDMPMLNRQEIAFLFLSLMFYIMFKENILVKLRKYLFIILGLGLILSHYSTTYSIIAILIFLVCFRPFLKKSLGYILFRKGKLIDSGINIFESKSSKSNLITIPMVIALISASFFWSSILTKTSSGSIDRVLNETLTAIRNNALDAKSGDTAYSLFYGKNIDPETELTDYNNKVVLETRKNAPDGVYYDDVTYAKYPIKVVPDEISTLTRLGKELESTGINITSFNYAVRQGSAKILQILIIVGFIFVLFKRKYLQKTLDVEFVLLALGSLILVLSQVILPVLSAEYGLLRAFQQALFFLGIFIVIGSLALTSYLGKTNQIVLTSLLAISFFFSSTGVFTSLLGGYGPQLHLSNDGSYYDLYYMHDSEATSIKWLNKSIETSEDSHAEIQSDRLAILKAKTFFDIDFLNDIYPALIRKNAYVYLGFRNTIKKQSSITYNSDTITYAYPVQFLEDNKDLIYNNGYSIIYK